MTDSAFEGMTVEQMHKHIALQTEVISAYRELIEVNKDYKKLIGDTILLWELLNYFQNEIDIDAPEYVQDFSHSIDALRTDSSSKEEL